MTDDTNRRGTLGVIAEALGGDHSNAASGPLTRAIPLLAIPMVLEMAMEALFAVTDVFFVAKIGASAVATVGLTESLMAVIYSVAFGLSMPAGAMVARRIGEEDRTQASVAAFQAVLLAFGVGVLMASTAVWSSTFLEWMGGDEEVITGGTNFAIISLLTSPLIMVLFVGGAIFRGAGEARLAMRAMWLANGLNIVLDPCFIFGWGFFPELGVTGAAVATAVGRASGAAYLLFQLARGPNVRLLAAARIDVGVMKTILAKSVGGTIQHLVETGSWIAMVRIIAQFGSAAIAAYTVTVRLIMFTLLPAWGFSNATATLVGQSLGANDPDRAERAVWLSGMYTVPVLGAMTIAFIAGPEWFVNIFTEDPQVRATAAQGLFIIGFGYIFYGWQMVTQQAFNGAADTTTPALINVACFWLLQIPLAWTLAHPFGMETNGIFMAAAISYSAAAVVGVVLVRRGAWKNVEV